MKLLLCVAGFAAIAFADLPGLIKQKQRRELVLYIIIFLLVLVFAVRVVVVGVPESPIKMIQSFYRDVLHLSFKNP